MLVAPAACGGAEQRGAVASYLPAKCHLIYCALLLHVSDAKKNVNYQATGGVDISDIFGGGERSLARKVYQKFMYTFGSLHRHQHQTARYEEEEKKKATF